MRKTPIANRTIFCLTLLSVAPAAAQERWTEDDVTERARAQAVEVLAADARARGEDLVRPKPSFIGRFR